MIFYTLQGPNYNLEIHDDKLRLLRKGWLKHLSREPSTVDWDLASLSHFEISIPQYILWGKIEWKTFDGSEGSFRFSTDAAMVKKIEKYLQKLIIRNHQNTHQLSPKKLTESSRSLAA